jgi:hypothetical protein
VRVKAHVFLERKRQFRSWDTICDRLPTAHSRMLSWFSRAGPLGPQHLWDPRVKLEDRAPALIRFSWPQSVRPGRSENSHSMSDWAASSQSSPIAAGPLNSASALGACNPTSGSGAGRIADVSSQDQSTFGTGLPPGST